MPIQTMRQPALGITPIADANVKFPTYGSSEAACFDLWLPTNAKEFATIIAPGQSAVFGLGYSMTIPEGWELKIYSRSGQGFKRGLRLVNCVGIIDADYTGEIKVGLYNDSAVDQVVCAADAIAQGQLIPLPPRPAFFFATELKTTERGAGGFGSTDASAADSIRFVPGPESVELCAAPAVHASVKGAMWFTKKPVTIQAIQWTGDNLREVITFTDGPPDTRSHHAGMAWDAYRDLVARDGLKIYTLEGKMLASPGDWIIRGVKGELYPCKPDIFQETYAAASPTPQALSAGPEASRAAPPSTYVNGAGIHAEDGASAVIRKLDARFHIVTFKAVDAAAASPQLSARRRRPLERTVRRHGRTEANESNHDSSRTFCPR